MSITDHDSTCNTNFVTKTLRFYIISDNVDQQYGTEIHDDDDSNDDDKLSRRSESDDDDDNDDNDDAMFRPDILVSKSFKIST